MFFRFKNIEKSYKKDSHLHRIRFKWPHKQMLYSFLSLLKKNTCSSNVYSKVLNRGGTCPLLFTIYEKDSLYLVILCKKIGAYDVITKY